jgi:ribonuclease HIII
VVEVGQKIVEQRGADALGLVAKLHHRTTQKIIAP